MKWELGQDFAKSTLEAFGLGDLDKLQEYKKSVQDFQHIYNPKTEMACRIALNAAVMTWKEIVQDTAMESGTEVVHIGPGFGQIICMGLGYHQMRNKMLKIMDAAAEKAIMLHQGLIIPNVIHSLECGSVVTNQAVYLAKLAEQAERYEDMAENMVSVASEDRELSVEERNLLSVAYKNMTGPLRASWRIVTSVEQNEIKANYAEVNLIKEYRQKIENELAMVCKGILDIINTHLIPSATSVEGKVFYYKMSGDYHKYLTEFSTGVRRKDYAQKSLEAYEAATQVAQVDLPATHPLRLGLALNFSVFYYEILNAPDRACHLAKKAFDDAIAELPTLTEESYKDSTLILQLLRDNLTLWTSSEE
ncbi:hypothetical protein ABOM_005794 [Aspergillus bombycis]|uniref:14-3-3 domain-containing protein n=1 Tax=Aspergillus bombycis TaxID=109264 RepID=A0A1F7ZZW0_9EURO|nr:hypothetical protein ABOM_005794 [Aspergillus bombycis]OGM44993.1 hypothetical protein ABOM_005794 [Aspergillus bombycis]